MRKKVEIDMLKCVRCGGCSAVCPQNAISLPDETILEINEKMCRGCSFCITFCPMDALRICGENHIKYGVL